jgi:ribosomal protein S14
VKKQQILEPKRREKRVNSDTELGTIELEAIMRALVLVFGISRVCFAENALPLHVLL